MTESQRRHLHPRAAVFHGQPTYVGVGDTSSHQANRPCYQVQTVGEAYTMSRSCTKTNFPQFHETYANGQNVYKACVCKRAAQGQGGKCCRTPRRRRFRRRCRRRRLAAAAVRHRGRGARQRHQRAGRRAGRQVQRLLRRVERRRSRSDYAAVDALFISFGRGEVVVFNRPPFGGRSRNPSWPNCVGRQWRVAPQLSAGIDHDLMVIDTYSTDATTGNFARDTWSTARTGSRRAAPVRGELHQPARAARRRHIAHLGEQTLSSTYDH